MVDHLYLVDSDHFIKALFSVEHDLLHVLFPSHDREVDQDAQ